MRAKEKGPERGDLLVSMGKRGIGTIYEVRTSRKVNRRDPDAPDRYAMSVKALKTKDVDAAWKPSKVIFRFWWYPRKKRKQTFEQFMRRRVPV